ncbi:MAG: FAD-dependent oxidoreductase [Deltaproteobacteria bacterium]|nr:FAD-dependent oxidoreductase [Deltaproteobacteria bacterium]
MSQNSYQIADGSEIAVVGGGPAASFFSLYLLHYARERGITPRITLYDQRNFDELGPKGCKGCAGILSSTLIRNLAELHLELSKEIIQNPIEGFAVHSPYATIDIMNPEATRIGSVYRGGGPRKSSYAEKISFDGWLLKQAQSRGVTVEHSAVSQISLDSPRPLVESAGKKVSYGLVVLATGVNAKPIPIAGSGYAPPETRIMAMNELHAGAEQVNACLGNVAHAFLLPHSGLIFGTLVPKGPFINVSVLGSGKYPVSVADFLRHDIVRRILPTNYELACGCRPRTAVGCARNYYGDRFVAVGDAAVSRLYKDGIGSSLLTAREAARTALFHGVSRHDFERNYRPFCDALHRDNRWGHILFSLNDITKNSPFFLGAQQRLIANEQNSSGGARPFTKAAWGMFTGSYSYRDIARMALNPASQFRLTGALLKEGLRRLTARQSSPPRQLYVGTRKVLILGSGFGGTYTLRHLVRSTNKNENVDITLISDENFFLFTPLLHEVAMGGIETRHIAYPIRRLHWRDRFTFVQAGIEKIDLAGRRVITAAGPLDFDRLVISLGSVTDMSALKLEGGGTVFTLKTLHDAMRMRNQIIDCFEQASIAKDPERQRQWLTFVIVGGGYIGVQTVTELRDFIYGNLLKYYRAVDSNLIRIVLVESERKIVARLHGKLGQYVMDQLHRMGIEVRMNSMVTRVGDGFAEINGSEELPSCTLIWTAGMTANPLIAELPAEKDGLGRVVVNEYMEVSGFPGVYALGDCSHFEDPISAQPIPPRAHTTVRQAKVVAENILADIRGTDRKPYRYTDTGEIVSIGDSKAVFRFLGLRLYGFPARLIWLVAYSMLVTGNYKRVQIIMDWFLSLIFGRDVTYLRHIK